MFTLPRIPSPKPELVRRLVGGLLTMKSNTVADQYRRLEWIIYRHRNTKFGLHYDFKNLSDYQSFSQHIPVHQYDTMEPWIQESLAGTKDVITPGKMPWFATSSGTTGKSKYIPVSYHALRYNHFAGGRQILLSYLYHRPDSRLYQGYGLVIGGGFLPNPLTGEQNVGFISAILQKTSPRYAQRARLPKPHISYLHDWTVKVEKTIDSTLRKMVTSISGQPSRCSSFLQKVTEQTQCTIAEIRPNLELVMRGGMSKTLYDDIFDQQLQGCNIQHYQVYNASEGFFAIQDRPLKREETQDMLLLLNHAVVYEFIPLCSYLSGNYDDVCMIDGVVMDQDYVILVTTTSGLYRYVLGDTVRFTNLDPYRIIVSGRTKYYLDVVGECSNLDQLQTALFATAQQFGGIIKEFTFGPKSFSVGEKGGYECVIERQSKPAHLVGFDSVLDAEISKANTYYDDERHDTNMLDSIIVHHVPEDTFYLRLQSKGKLGGQHKVPRVSTSREMIEELLILSE